MGDEKIDEMHLKLDELDFELLDILEKRLEISKKLSDYKKQRGFYIENKGRSEEAVNARVGKSDLNPNFVKNLFESVFSESKRIQDEPTG